MSEIAKIKVGSPHDWSNFMGPVMYVLLPRWNTSIILCCTVVAQHTIKFLVTSRRPRTLVAKFLSEAQVEVYFSFLSHILMCRKGDDSKGYFIQPTVILSKDPKSITIVEEIFGPVITVCISPHHVLAPFTFNIGLRLQ